VKGIRDFTNEWGNPYSLPKLNINLSHNISCASAASFLAWEKGKLRTCRHTKSIQIRNPKDPNTHWVMNIYEAISLAANAHKTAKGRTQQEGLGDN